MTNKAIEDLTQAAPITGSELLHIVQSGNSRKASLTEVGSALGGITTTQNWAVPFRGALVKRNTDLTSGITFPLLVPWEAAVYDTEGFFNAGDPTKLVVPSGITKVRVLAKVQAKNTSAEHSLYLGINKNGGVYDGQPTHNFKPGSTGWVDNEVFVVSPVLEVAEGDYFEVRANESVSGESEEIKGGEDSWFAIEVVEVSDAQARPYDAPVTLLGAPAASGLLDLDVASREYRIPENGAGSQFYADTAPSAETVFDVQKDGVSVGSITFAASSNTGTYTGTETTFPVGSVRKIVAPGSVNGIADLAFNLKLELT